MKTAEEILAERFNITAEMLDTNSHCKVSTAIAAMKAYSLSCQEALREKIASEAEIHYPHNRTASGYDEPEIDREAIRNTPLIEG